MALFPKTPGVYVQEISTLPSSVVAVPTAVPVFIGYTEKAVIDGDNWNYANGPTNPVRVESLMEYQAAFGGAFPETFDADLSGSNVDISISDTVLSGNDYRLYYNLLMYFGNGGGPCYIVSTGAYGDTMSPPLIDAGELQDAIAKAELVDEITLILVPDSMSSAVDNGLGERKAIYDAMLAHCAKMQNRFAVLDVLTDTNQTIALDASDFRNNTVGANNLSYGAAYYPSFAPTFSFSYSDDDVTINAPTGVNLPSNILLYDGLSLATVNNGIKASAVIKFQSSFTIASPTVTLLVYGVELPDDNYASADDIADAIIADATLNTIFSTTVSSDEITITAITAGTPANVLVTGSVIGTEVTIESTTSALSPDKSLYGRIQKSIDSLGLTLYPSSTMAGIYSAVDNSRGVWKAPANIGVSQLRSLNRNVKDSDQSDLNVDATSGKSIDVIRDFTGRGTLVWGARTLDGNSNEWRYVNVRRTFLMVEDSCKKATQFVVFEPNDANTWVRVKGMISNFLTNIWRDGALAGEKPEQAFFVRVGLGETMTAQDILEGRLIVQIGLAVVRPAEFIILNFEHKLQEA